MGAYYYSVQRNERELFRLTPSAQLYDGSESKIDSDAMQAIQRAVINHATTTWSQQAKRDGDMHKEFSVRF